MIARLEWNVDTDGVQRAARVVALSALDTLEDAHERVRRRDVEAIHDFRVALRRLRSWLRVYHAALDDTVRQRTRQRLLHLANAANELRDLDVQISWLRSERKALGDARFAAASWILAGLKGDRKRAWRRFKKAMIRDFAKAEHALRDELTFYVATRNVYTDESPPDMRAASGRLLRAQAAKLAHALARVRSADDGRRLHRARISAKRARYVLEQLATQAPQLSSAAEELARFQDAVGELRDAQLLAHRVAREVTSVATERTALVASELVYRPTGMMDFSRVTTESPFDASLSLLFARLHDRISTAARAVTASLAPDASARLVAAVEASAMLFDDALNSGG